MILIGNVVQKVANGFVFVAQVVSYMTTDNISYNPVVMNVAVTIDSRLEFFLAL